MESNDISVSIKTEKNENLAQLFSCDFCEISKNTFSYTTPPVAASAPLFFRSHVLTVHEVKMCINQLKEIYFPKVKEIVKLILCQTSQRVISILNHFVK